MLTLPTQEELDKLKSAAESVRDLHASNASWNDYSVASDLYMDLAMPEAILALLTLIDAQNKRIAELLEDNKDLHI